MRSDRVLLNLVLNSLQAMQATPPERRVVEIDVAVASGRLHSQVADHRPGIPAELAEQVFAPFLTTKPDGLGLGLNICRTMLESHWGQFTFADQVGGDGYYIGVGSRWASSFLLRLDRR